MRIMAAGRAGRSEEMLHAMIIRQPWLPPWFAGWGDEGVSAARAGSCAWEGAGWWGVRGWAEAWVEPAIAVCPVAPMSHRRPAMWDHERARKAVKATERCMEGNWFGNCSRVNQPK